MRLHLTDPVDGVAALLFESAHGAYEQASVNGTSLFRDITDPMLRLNVVQGTMTFVETGACVCEDKVCLHTGPMEMLTGLGGFCELIPCTVSAYVPFTNAQDIAGDREMGFGPRLDLVEWILKHNKPRRINAYDDLRAKMKRMTIA